MDDHESVVVEIYSDLVDRLEGLRTHLNEELGHDPHDELRNELVIYAIDKRSEEPSGDGGTGLKWVRQAAIDLLHGRPDPGK